MRTLPLAILLPLALAGLVSCDRPAPAPTPQQAAPPATTATDEIRMQQARALPPLVPGDPLPDYAFVGTSGDTIRLSDFRGKVLAFTFFFTTCPYSNQCPQLSENMAAVRKQLAAGPGPVGDRWQLLSITIDPQNDTPGRLKDYAARYHAAADRWDFLTGDPVEIASLGWQCGLEFWRTNPGQPISHNTRTVVVDPAGRVRWIGTATDWKPEELIRQMERAAR